MGLGLFGFMVLYTCKPPSILCPVPSVSLLIRVSGHPASFLHSEGGLWTRGSDLAWQGTAFPWPQ